jgi:hypothetical protein
MKAQLAEILNDYSRRKAGYIPLADREELIEKIMMVFEAELARRLKPSVDWAGIDSAKWGNVEYTGYSYSLDEEE